jgi:hypothetical protein
MAGTSYGNVQALTRFFEITAFAGLAQR